MVFLNRFYCVLTFCYLFSICVCEESSTCCDDNEDYTWNFIFNEEEDKQESDCATYDPEPDWNVEFKNTTIDLKSLSQNSIPTCLNGGKEYNTDLSFPIKGVLPDVELSENQTPNCQPENVNVDLESKSSNETNAPSNKLQPDKPSTNTSLPKKHFRNLIDPKDFEHSVEITVKRYPGENNSGRPIIRLRSRSRPKTTPPTTNDLNPTDDEIENPPQGTQVTLNIHFKDLLDTLKKSLPPHGQEQEGAPNNPINQGPFIKLKSFSKPESPLHGINGINSTPNILPSMPEIEPHNVTLNLRFKDHLRALKDSLPPKPKDVKTNITDDNLPDQQLGSPIIILRSSSGNRQPKMSQFSPPVTKLINPIHDKPKNVTLNLRFKDHLRALKDESIPKINQNPIYNPNANLSNGTSPENPKEVTINFRFQELLRALKKSSKVPPKPIMEHPIGSSPNEGPENRSQNNDSKNPSINIKSSSDHNPNVPSNNQLTPTNKIRKLPSDSLDDSFPTERPTDVTSLPTDRINSRVDTPVHPDSDISRDRSPSKPETVEPHNQPNKSPDDNFLPTDPDEVIDINYLPSNEFDVLGTLPKDFLLVNPNENQPESYPVTDFGDPSVTPTYPNLDSDMPGVYNPPYIESNPQRNPNMGPYKSQPNPPIEDDDNLIDLSGNPIPQSHSGPTRNSTNPKKPEGYNTPHTNGNAWNNQPTRNSKPWPTNILSTPDENTNSPHTGYDDMSPETIVPLDEILTDSVPLNRNQQQKGKNVDTDNKSTPQRPHIQDLDNPQSNKLTPGNNNDLPSSTNGNPIYPHQNPFSDNGNGPTRNLNQPYNTDTNPQWVDGKNRPNHEPNVFHKPPTTEHDVDSPDLIIPLDETPIDSVPTVPNSIPNWFDTLNGEPDNTENNNSPSPHVPTLEEPVFIQPDNVLSGNDFEPTNSNTSPNLGTNRPRPTDPIQTSGNPGTLGGNRFPNNPNRPPIDWNKPHNTNGYTPATDGNNQPNMDSNSKSPNSSDNAPNTGYDEVARDVIVPLDDDLTEPSPTHYYPTPDMLNPKPDDMATNNDPSKLGNPLYEQPNRTPSTNGNSFPNASPNSGSHNPRTNNPLPGRDNPVNVNNNPIPQNRLEPTDNTQTRDNLPGVKYDLLPQTPTIPNLKDPFDEQPNRAPSRNDFPKRPWNAAPNHQPTNVPIPGGDSPQFSNGKPVSQSGNIPIDGTTTSNGPSSGEYLPIPELPLELDGAPWNNNYDFPTGNWGTIPNFRDLPQPISPVPGNDGRPIYTNNKPVSQNGNIPVDHTKTNKNPSSGDYLPIPDLPNIPELNGPFGFQPDRAPWNNNHDFPTGNWGTIPNFRNLPQPNIPIPGSDSRPIYTNKKPVSQNGNIPVDNTKTNNSRPSGEYLPIPELPLKLDGPLYSQPDVAPWNNNNDFPTGNWGTVPNFRNLPQPNIPVPGSDGRPIYTNNKPVSQNGNVPVDHTKTNNSPPSGEYLPTPELPDIPNLARPFDTPPVTNNNNNDLPKGNWNIVPNVEANPQWTNGPTNRKPVLQHGNVPTDGTRTSNSPGCVQQLPIPELPSIPDLDNPFPNLRKANPPRFNPTPGCNPVLQSHDVPTNVDNPTGVKHLPLPSLPSIPDVQNGRNNNPHVISNGSSTPNGKSGGTTTGNSPSGVNHQPGPPSVPDLTNPKPVNGGSPKNHNEIPNQNLNKSSTEKPKELKITVTVKHKDERKTEEPASTKPKPSDIAPIKPPIKPPKSKDTPVKSTTQEKCPKCHSSQVRDSGAVDVYWRDFEGHIPADAIIGGHYLGASGARTPIYLAHAYLTRNKNYAAIQPAQFFAGSTSLMATFNGAVYAEDMTIQILCGDQEAVAWVPQGFARSLDPNVDIVHAGYEKNYNLTFARTKHYNNRVIGKAVFKGAMSYAYDGKEQKRSLYDVLCYRKSLIKKNVKFSPQGQLD